MGLLNDPLIPVGVLMNTVLNMKSGRRVKNHKNRFEGEKRERMEEEKRPCGLWVMCPFWSPTFTTRGRAIMRYPVICAYYEYQYG
jgi:hypothetical protein